MTSFLDLDDCAAMSPSAKTELDQLRAELSQRDAEIQRLIHDLEQRDCILCDEWREYKQRAEAAEAKCAELEEEKRQLYREFVGRDGMHLSIRDALYERLIEKA